MAVKQMIVMRKDLNMRKGKMVAQGAHASLGAVLRHVNYVPNPGDHPKTTDLRLKQHNKVMAWLGGKFTKICVYVESEAQLIELEMKAEAAGLITCLITDSGLTEFNGELTVTCVAIGPDTDEALAPITGELKLL